MIDDSAARRAALDLKRSVCIRAPAGSGKTGLLIQRMLAALAQVEQPEGVLAITFTRKAASEIQQRLVAALQAAQNFPEPDDAFAQYTWQLARRVLARDSSLQWQLIENPSRIRATTIDALNREIAARMPILSGLGSLPEPVDDARDLYRTAILNCFSRLQQPHCPADVASNLNAVLSLGQNRLDKLMDALCEMLATREQWLGACVAASAQPQATGARLILERYIQQALDAVGDLPAALCEQWLSVVHGLYDEGDPTWASLRAIDQWPERVPAALALWQELIPSLLTKAGTWRSPAGMKSNTGFPKGAYTVEAKALITRFTDCGERCAQGLHALRLLPTHYPEDLDTLAQALNHVLLSCCAELKLVFAGRQQADYAELGLAAVSALEDPDSGAGERQDSQLQHLLVDEMQDTSHSQIKLLENLVSNWQDGDGRSLFLVGDPQQSIYLFRQARVELFQGLFADGGGRLGPVKLHALQLQRNFRSRPGVVAWCNQHLQVAFDQRNSPVPFAASGATRDFETIPAAQVIEATSTQEEARLACDRIADSLAQHPQWRIAVLARSRNHFTAVIAELKSRNIAYSGQDLDPLAQTPLARNFLACVRSLRHSADELAWMRLLRSPGVGLSWADLDALAAQHPALGWAARVRQSVDGLSADGQLRLANLQDALTHLDATPALRSQLSLAASWLHSRLGMRGDLDAVGLANLQTLENLLAAHCRGGQLQDELRFSAALERLYSACPPAAVELMTVHRSKGLEFEHVLLVGCNRGLRKADTPLLRYEQQGPHWMMAPKPRVSLQIDTPATRVYRLLNDQAHAEAAAESLRLLYVAATRARECLDVLLSPARRSDARSFAAILTDAGLSLKLTAAPATETEQTWRDVQHPVLTPAVQRPRVEIELALPRDTYADSPSRLTGTQRDRAQAGLDWPRLEASLTGTLYHECLERMADKTTLPAIADLESWRTPLIAGMRRRGLPAARTQVACERVLELARSTLTGWGPWLLQARVWARNEYAVTAWRDGAWQNAIIDRCFEDEAGQLWVIDYKSNQAPMDERAAWLQEQCAHYDAQLSNYVALLSALRPHKPITALLYFADGDTLMRQTAPQCWQAVQYPDELLALSS